MAFKGFVHHVGNGGAERGACTMQVGVCHVYDEGPTALLTINQPGARVVETAFTRDEALALAEKLLDVATSLRVIQ